MTRVGLHQVDRRSSVERMAGMGMPHPMRRDRLLQPGGLGHLRDDSPSVPRVQRATGPREEDVDIIRLIVTESCQLRCELLGDEHMPGLVALAVDRELALAVLRIGQMNLQIPVVGE